MSLSLTYNITGELSRYQVTATGLHDGFSTTFRGSVPSVSEAQILIKYAGIWEVSVREGINNPKHRQGSPYLIIVNPAETDPTEGETEYERVLTAGDAFVLNITLPRR